MSARCGIYAIVSVDNGRRYIGSSADIYKRWDQHRRRLRAGVHHCEHLQNIYSKYGDQHCLFMVIEFCQVNQLTRREQAWIDRTPAGQLVNSSKIAGSMRGYKHSLATKLARTGKKTFPSVRAKISATLRGISEELSEIQKEVWKRKRALGLPGHTLETRMKMRESHKKAWIERKKLGFVSRKHTPETIAKMRASQQARYRRERERARPCLRPI